ncbi:hypothetical protein DL762_000801 [Monosporascus cannonballus]|uniref:SH3 domain-containing protein n=1 Tax=Monosporascus cannonballus TaxID=155416 RepID=A0ABY0HIA9_9PEZI|nr:hypothetical protein DL762_000801 [Monosporascus cannonballus]RYO96380.1 hypothetical protein DL763_003236 [Monosporascus cannonballus]
MSFKGFQKSVIRAPQQIKAKFNIGEHTKDAVFIDSERRFQELEKETKHLHDESKKYFEAINGMLDHQIEFSQAMTEIYKPISGRVSDPDSLVVAGNVEGIRACEEYEAIVKDLQDTLAPELEMIESRVIRPANELLDVLKVIRKTAVKREHKKLDYDRHNATLKKLRDKKEKSARDEKAMWKAENDVEQATQDFNYFNDLLKEELPKLFALERQFIQPLFQSFYYMQLNIFYTLHEKMQQCDIGYFDLTLDVEEAFFQKRGDIQEQAEKLSIVRFKTSGRPRPPKYGNKPQHAIEGNKPAGLITAGPSTNPTTPSAGSSAKFSGGSHLQPPQPQLAHAAAEDELTDHPPPPYSATAASPSLASWKSSTSPAPLSPGMAAAAAAKSKPPPPKPKPKALMGGSAKPAVETVTALYDYQAQAAGDLSFRAGDVIEIVSRTQNENEWWTGKCHGQTGSFPGNYVESLQGVPKGWMKLKDADPAQPIRLRIALDQENPALLEQKLYDISAPQDPLYGKHLSREELSHLMRPREESTAAVADWLRASGIPAAHIENAGEWINFRTNVSRAEDLLGTRFAIYYYVGTDIKRLRTLRYQVPAEVRSHITMIQPTTRFGQMRPQRLNVVEVLDKEDITPPSVALAANVPTRELDVEFCNSTITPQCLRALYRVNDTIADAKSKSILGVGGFLEQYAKHDSLDLFLERYAPYAQTQNFTTHLINGGRDDQNDTTHDDAEANLDIQYAAALGFDADLRYYSTGGRGPLIPDLDQPDPNEVSNEPYLEFLTYMLGLDDDQLPHTLSISYGEDEQSVPRTYAQKVCAMFGALGARGTSVIVASGDTGPGSACQTNDGNRTTRFLPTFPGGCPFVTSVGGTTGVAPERAADFSSGGFSDVFERPAYQAAAVSAYLGARGGPNGDDAFAGLYDARGRGFPDVAAQAARYRVMFAPRGGRGPGGGGMPRLVAGTSAAAPTVAALVSLLNGARLRAGRPPLGFLNPWLYSAALEAGGFADVVDGRSRGCTGVDKFSYLPTPYVPRAGWDAVPGWDPVTGLGTPLFDRLLEAAAPGVRLPRAGDGAGKGGDTRAGNIQR